MQTGETKEEEHNGKSEASRNFILEKKRTQWRSKEEERLMDAERKGVGFAVVLEFQGSNHGGGNVQLS